MRSFLVLCPSLALVVAACSVSQQDAPSTSSTGSGTAATSFHVGGTVSGLAGAGLVLRLNGAGDLAVSADGTFVFPTALAHGAAYQVTVAAQPAGPTQLCSVAGGSGTIAASDVSAIAVTCATSAFKLGGTLSGLVDGTVTLDDGTEQAKISANGAFAFATPIASGSKYAVTIAGQPAGQVCTLDAASGSIVDADVATLAVACTPSSYKVGGTVKGLEGTVTLHSSTGDALEISQDGAFQFPTALAHGQGYQVIVSADPMSPHQHCAVVNGSGTIAAADVSDVAIDCTTNTYQVKVSVSGLVGTGLTLQNNGADDLAIAADGNYAFATAVQDMHDFAVTVSAQPTSPDQLCTVDGGDGTISGADATGITVSCVTSQ